MTGTCPICQGAVCEGPNYSGMLCAECKTKHYDYESYQCHRIRELEARVAELETRAKEERASILDRFSDALKPGYSEFPASDKEILACARDLVEELSAGPAPIGTVNRMGAEIVGDNLLIVQAARIIEKGISTRCHPDALDKLRVRLGPPRCDDCNGTLAHVAGGGAKAVCPVCDRDALQSIAETP